MLKKQPFLILIFIGLLFTVFFYGDVLFHPNNYLFNNLGDAAKNYYTYCYHIKHDTSFLNFSGMNYPYGEHFLYTDCHPVLANLFKVLAFKFPFFQEYSIGILNFLLISSIFFTFIISFLLLKEFKINNWISLLFSISITLLAPQIFRLSGHLALSYSIAIPLSWLLTIKYFTNNHKIKYIVLLFLNNIFWLFIHSYLGIIILFFLSAMVVIQYVNDKQRINYFKNYALAFGAIVLPIIIFYAFVSLTDTHIGRTDNPSGFFQYNAELDDVFLPNHAPLKPLFDVLTGNIIKQEWEAWAYVGFFTSILFLVIIILFIIRLVKPKKSKSLSLLFDQPLLNAALISSGLVLLFAMAFPFKQFDNLIDLFPIIKPFRATGRFTWPFYFVALVFSASVIQKIYQHFIFYKKPVLAVSICLIVGGFDIIEGLPYHIEISQSIKQSKNSFNLNALSDSYKQAISKINAHQFQSIITLPFYYQGSECFSRPRYDETVRASFIISYQTGLPIMCANLTRTSVFEAKKIVQIVSPDFYEKQIQYDLKSKKPILVITTKDNMTAYEKNLLAKCKPIFLSNDVSIYSLEIEDLFKNTAQAQFDSYKKQEATLFKNHSFIVTKDSSFLFYNDFDNQTSLQPFRGKGGFQSVKKGKNIFADFAGNTFKSKQPYHFSIWMYNGEKDALNDWFRVIVEEYNEENNSIKSTTFFPEQSETIYGNWSLLEGNFEVKNPKNKISIISIGKDNSKANLFVDDLLIKEEGLDVYKLYNNHELFYNNHQVIKK